MKKSFLSLIAGLFGGHEPVVLDITPVAKPKPRTLPPVAPVPVIVDPAKPSSYRYSGNAHQRRVARRRASRLGAAA